MDNQANRSDGDFDFGTKIDQSKEMRKVSIVNLLRFSRNF